MGERTESSKKYLTDLPKRLRKKVIAYRSDRPSGVALFINELNEELKNRIQGKQSDSQINSSVPAADKISSRFASLTLNDPDGLRPDDGHIYHQAIRPPG